MSGTWKQGFSGERIYLLTPEATEIHFETITHVLAHTPRFGGHLTQDYSVAAHSVHVAELMRERYGDDGAFLGLMHDAHEAYVGDMPTPLKNALGRKWRQLEKPWEHYIREHFGVSQTPELLAALKEADLQALTVERHTLLAHHVPWGDPFDSIPIKSSIRFTHWWGASAKLDFERAFARYSHRTLTNLPRV